MIYPWTYDPEENRVQVEEAQEFLEEEEFMEELIVGDIYVGSEVRDGQNYDGQHLIEIHLYTAPSESTYVVVDRSTAARLINQLRRTLDK